MGALGGLQGGENTELTAYSTANEPHASHHIIIGTTWRGHMQGVRPCYPILKSDIPSCLVTVRNQGGVPQQTGPWGNSEEGASGTKPQGSYLPSRKLIVAPVLWWSCSERLAEEQLLWSQMQQGPFLRQQARVASWL